MPISLSDTSDKLNLRLKNIEGAIVRHKKTPVLSKKIDRFALQEGLVSSLWQTWNWFCREVTVNSALGTNTTSGAAVTSPYIHNTDEEVAFAAKKLAQKQAVGVLKPIAGDHLEPTWGDFKKLSLIITGLATSNSSNLLTGLGSSTAISDLQLCRNASAHVSPDRINDVRDARVRYLDTKFLHPSDMIFWIEPSTNDYLWKVWMSDIRTSAAIAIT